jgi:hypothetical protein
MRGEGAPSAIRCICWTRSAIRSLCLWNRTHVCKLARPTFGVQQLLGRALVKGLHLHLQRVARIDQWSPRERTIQRCPFLPRQHVPISGLENWSDLPREVSETVSSKSSTFDEPQNKRRKRAKNFPIFPRKRGPSCRFFVTLCHHTLVLVVNSVYSCGGEGSGRTS